MGKVTEQVLLRRAVVRGVRTVVRYHLLCEQDRILNDVEEQAVQRFDEALANGEDLEEVRAEILSRPIDVRAILR